MVQVSSETKRAAIAEDKQIALEEKTETVFEEAVNAWKKERKEFIALKIKMYF